MQANTRGEIDYDRYTPSLMLRKNIEIVKGFFQDDETVKYRMCQNDSCCLVFIDSMVDQEKVNHYILQPILLQPEKKGVKDPDETLQIGELVVAHKFSEAILAVLGGDTLMMRSGTRELVLLNTKGYPVRAIQEPDNEKALFGPREGFTESLMINTTMLRRRLLTSDLKISFMTVSKRTNARACLCYLDSLVNREVLEELRRRLDGLDVDSFMDTYAISEHIRDSKKSIFNTIGKTERPDTAATKLLDGGVVLMLDGSPVVLMVPFIFVENFHSQDDRYIGYHYASVSRILRYMAFFVSISVGALYISLVTFHSEMLPLTFMLTISAAISGLPMPTYMEFIVMMLVFEMLRETGIRMSTKFGQALSIVGALVIGQAAVEARFISAPMVIIVAVSAITGLMVSSLSPVVILVRMLGVIFATFYGFYGYSCVLLALFIHLFSLESFGIQYTANMLSFKKSDMQNTYLRPPSPAINLRTKFVARDRRRSR